MKLIKEKIYGNMASVFHRTSVSDLVNKIFDEGFKPGYGDMYGKGFYATYELESQQGEYMADTYGPIIVKFAVSIQNFIVFDYGEFRDSPNFNIINRLYRDETTIDNYIVRQLSYFKMDHSKFDNDEARKTRYTSKIALWCYNNIPNFTRKCEGIVFTGSRDGQVLVSYNTGLIFPLSYSTDEGNTWNSVEKNLNYLKQVSKAKLTPFSPSLALTPEDFGIKRYEFTLNGKLNVRGDVDLSGRGLDELPFEFGIIEGGGFDCSGNNLTNLKNGPSRVDGVFKVSHNPLETLNGSPSSVLAYICNVTRISSLRGLSSKIYEDILVGDNSSLRSLVGSPNEVNGSFICSRTALRSLEDGPKKVRANFVCEDATLTSLKGAPEYVGDAFIVRMNELKTLEFLPKTIKGDLECQANPLISPVVIESNIGGRINLPYKIESILK